MVRIICFSLQSYSRSSSSTVVTISYVKIRNFVFKYLFNSLYRLLVVNYPKMMSKTIFLSNKIVDRFFVIYDISYYLINFLMSRISKEYWFNISISNVYVNHSIIFLVLTSKFVFLNLIIEIIFNMSTTNNTILSSSIHRLSVDI